MFATWTWNQMLYEIGIFVAFLLVIVCAGYLTRKVTRVIRTRERKLLDQGIATGLASDEIRSRGKKYSFGVLDLLVAITLIGALAGLIIGLSGENNKGMPFKYWDDLPIFRILKNPKLPEK
jgi:hypothetical protein